MISPEFGQFCEIFTRGMHAPQPLTRIEAGKQELQLSFKIEEIKDSAKELFDQGLRMVGEYANLKATQITAKGRAGDDVYFSTHIAPVIINGQERRFEMMAESYQSGWEDHKCPSWILPLSGPIKIFMSEKKDEGYVMLFNIRKRPHNGQYILNSPFREDNDPQAIRAASELLEEIEKYLSENYIPLSKQSKPEPKPRGIRKIMSAFSSKLH